MNLNEILDVSNKCADNLSQVLEEIKSYNCSVNIYDTGKIKVSFALMPGEFVDFIKRFDLDFYSAVHCKKDCRLFVCAENIEFFTLLSFEENIQDDYLIKKNRQYLEIIEELLKLDE